MTGSVSLRDALSSISDSQLTEHFAKGARRVTLTALRYVAMPPAFEIVRVLMLADVCDTHSMMPSFSTSARFVLRFIMLRDQFSIVE